ncbi:Trp biosynthesis-associated membrane protein [Cellulomonas chitinilytica]|nr:Trp biosynthesis-associated membrane protein [Cellulomonas chitinilytica]
MVLLAVVSAVPALPTWLTTTGTTPLRGTVPVSVSGSQVAPGIFAAAVALLAAAAAVALVGRVGRWVVAVVVLGCGVLVAVAAGSVIADPLAAAAPVVAEVTGVGHISGPVQTTAWPWVAVVAGAVVVLGALWFVRSSAGWAGASRRHEAAAGRAVDGPDDERSAWDALSRGDDPS